MVSRANAQGVGGVTTLTRGALTGRTAFGEQDQPACAQAYVSRYLIAAVSTSAVLNSQLIHKAVERPMPASWDGRGEGEASAEV